MHRDSRAASRSRPPSPYRCADWRLLLFVSCVALLGAGEAAATAVYSASSSASVEIVGFEDAEGNPISKTGLIIGGSTSISADPTTDLTRRR